MDILISEELRRKLQQCSGWSSTPVKLFLQTLKSAGKYHLLSVTGRSGPLLPRRIRKIPAGPNRAWDMFQGLCFEVGAENPDIFMPVEAVQCVLASEKAASVIKGLCDNVTVTPCEEVWSQSNPVDLFSSKRSAVLAKPSRRAEQTAARDRVKKRGA